MRNKLLLLAGVVLSGCSMGGHQGAGNYADYAHQGASVYGAGGGCAPMPAYQPCVPPAPVRPACAPVAQPSPCSVPLRPACAPVQPCGTQGPAFGGTGSSFGGFPFLMAAPFIGLAAKPNDPRTIPPYVHPTKPPTLPPVLPPGLPPVFTPTPPLYLDPTLTPRPVQHLQQHQGKPLQYQAQSQANLIGGAATLTGLYGAIGAVNYDAGGDNSGIKGTVGHTGNGIIGAEAEVTQAIIKNDVMMKYDASLDKDKLTGYDLGTESSIAGFAVGRVPVASNVKLLGRVGYHGTKRKKADYLNKQANYTATQVSTFLGSCRSRLETACTTISTSAPVTVYNDREFTPVKTYTTTQTGVAFGAGLEADISPFDAIRADVTAYDMGDSYDKAAAISYLRKF